MRPIAKTVQSPFKKILLATKFCSNSEGLLRTGFRLCQMNEASLRILHVRSSDTAAQADPSLPTETGILENEPVGRVGQLEERARQAGVSCSSCVETGVAADKILAAIHSMETDLAILGTSELRGSQRLVFGPTAEAVMRKASCPIMTVGPVAADLVKTNALNGVVIFATDFHSVTREAIRLAVSYCRSTGLRLHCLHVLPRTLQLTDGDQALPAILTSALRHLAATSAVGIDLPVCCVTYGSEISNAIVDYARKQQASLIFLGVRRSSMVAADDPLPIVFRVITEAPCPVITIVCDAQLDPLYPRPGRVEPSPLHLP
jgi:nucleotide-binding universal stress UspA family protein